MALIGRERPGEDRDGVTDRDMDAQSYAEAVFVQEDRYLKEIKEDIRARGMPAIFVPPVVGAFIHWMAKSHDSQAILEIGALGGYSGLWLARALRQPGGRLVSLELNPEYARVAESHLTKAGLGDVVEYRVGPALESLQQLDRENARFDFFLIDADKENYPEYLQWCVRLAAPRAIIVADNALQGGRVYAVEHREPSTEAVRRFNQLAAADPRLRALLLPIGDGLVVAEVVAPGPA